MNPTSWHRSSFCTNSACVEVAFRDGSIGVRQSRRADSAVLVFDQAEWRAFIEGVKAGEFDG